LSVCGDPIASQSQLLSDAGRSSRWRFPNATFLHHSDLPIDHVAFVFLVLAGLMPKISVLGVDRPFVNDLG
jgi:hypothetical protein